LVLGFILIKTGDNQEEEVLEILQNNPEIMEAHALFGEYDLIAKVGAKDFRGVSGIVLKHIRSIDGVIHTETLPGISF
jgi:DNA-binding Lrp family transcriptional regulator